MTLDVRPLTVSDIISFYPHRRDAYTSHKVIDMVYDLQMFMQMGPCYALHHKDKVVAIYGCAIVSRSMGHFWMAGSDLLDDVNKFDIVKTARRLINQVFDHYKLHRIQVDVDTGIERNIKFIAALGFTIEGRCNKYYDDGKDAFIAGIVR